MKIDDNYFVLFGLPIGFQVDTEALASRYRELQRQYHPDRFAHHPEEQQKAVHWSAQLNTAYDTLNNTVKRASYLLELVNRPISLNTSIADTDFLMSQLELREQLDEAESAEQLIGLRLEVEEWLHFMANFLADIRQQEDKFEDDDYYDED